VTIRDQGQRDNKNLQIQLATFLAHATVPAQFCNMYKHTL